MIVSHPLSHINLESPPSAWFDQHTPLVHLKGTYIKRLHSKHIQSHPERHKNMLPSDVFPLIKGDCCWQMLRSLLNHKASFNQIMQSSIRIKWDLVLRLGKHPPSTHALLLPCFSPSLSLQLFPSTLIIAVVETQRPQLPMQSAALITLFHNSSKNKPS